MDNKKKEACPLCQKAYIQMFYSQLLCPNARILHVALDIQFLVLIAWGRYICMKKKTHCHHLLCKGRL